ncbi:helix-turn-helix domain-containing protein [Streptomyces sp. NBC_01754]|uniref:helix-turn-helix domain-containing protein n=1 Tax=Streptomyces sp. NBC_01754 TaxID=2975930 RepID=UPI002DDB1CA6|nr:helix-turn-helix transcriptional regulator [Streptomyces sp. NBC_01754]WSC94490.1 helix-turn-helix domain-containing protein [Streptomyces sp. NBC_01754]
MSERGTPGSISYRRSGTMGLDIEEEATMGKTQGPVVQRRRLGRELRKLREDAGLTIEEAGAQIQRSDSTISRIETGARAVQIIELKGLLEAYGTPQSERDSYLRMLREAPEQGWWTEYEGTLPPGLDTYIGLESDAATLRVFALGIVHSLVQTEDYARAVIRPGRPTASTAVIDKLVSVRLERQKVLVRSPEPVQLTVVLDEGSLRRTVGGPAAMRTQVQHLIHMAEKIPNVTLQVLPYDRGAHGAMNGGFTLIDFPDPGEPTVAYLDTPAGNLYMQKPHDTRRFDQLFGQLRGAALDAEHGSIRFLRALLEEK